MIATFTDTDAKLRGHGKLCHEDTTIDPPVRLYQKGRDRFTVQYGKQVKADMTYADAAEEYGRCIMHALACASRLDNRMKGEKS